MTAATEPVPPMETLFKDRYFFSGIDIGSGIQKWFKDTALFFVNVGLSDYLICCASLSCMLWSLFYNYKYGVICKNYLRVVLKSLKSRTVRDKNVFEKKQWWWYP